jgi:hypothetical protein
VLDDLGKIVLVPQAGACLAIYHLGEVIVKKTIVQSFEPLAK